MTELMQANRQWSTRAPDERFTSLLDMQDFKRSIRDRSRSHIISSRKGVDRQCVAAAAFA